MKATIFIFFSLILIAVAKEDQKKGLNENQPRIEDKEEAQLKNEKILDDVSLFDITSNIKRFGFKTLCVGYEKVALGQCNNAYIKCIYGNNYGYQLHITYAIENCPTGQIFNGVSCEQRINECLGTWTKKVEQINTETDYLMETMAICERGEGVYVSTKSACSRQAYVCYSLNQGSTLTCPPGMIMRFEPLECIPYPRGCAPTNITVDEFTPFTQYAINRACLLKPWKNQSTSSIIQSCKTWYVNCQETKKEVIYCSKDMIYDERRGRCRKWKSTDHCIMPNICNGNNWKMMELGECNRYFVYCKGAQPIEYVCAEGFVFAGDRCVLASALESKCEKCSKNEKHHHSPYQACNEYSVCLENQWKTFICPPGMSYSNTANACIVDSSCAKSVKCVQGTSYKISCNEYMICNWNGVFERNFCPPLHRWEPTEDKCIIDNNCLPNTACTENEIIETIDCEVYHQCVYGKWIEIKCNNNIFTGSSYRHPKACAMCSGLHGKVLKQRVECKEGSLKANPMDCSGYAICKNGAWTNEVCESGLLWNQQKQQCSLQSDCNIFKPVECTHGQRLVGKKCDEYIECIHGSWITMQCLRGHSFDSSTNRCTRSENCFEGNYLQFANTPLFLPAFIQPSSYSAYDHIEPQRLWRRHYGPSSQNCRYSTTVGDQFDCNRYYLCTKDGYKSKTCPFGSGYAQESGNCEEGHRCNRPVCNENEIVEKDVCGHYKMCKNGRWKYGICENNQQFVNNKCSGSCDEYGSIFLSNKCVQSDIWPDDKNCNRYYVCIGGHLEERFCSPGTAFDKKNGFCNTNQQCDKSLCIDGDVLEDKDDCTRYLVCEEGMIEEHICPYGLIYNRLKNACEEGNCIGEDPHAKCKETTGNLEYRADPLNCHKFYQCAHGEWISKDCPGQLVWNPEKIVCDWPTNVPSCVKHGIAVSQ